jgi:hypothetical protein
VLPITLSDDWLLVFRSILPITATPAPAGAVGIGDLNLSFFFSPKTDGRWTLGLGPTINLPTATPGRFGSEKLSIGPTGVLVVTVSPVVLGLLVNQVWSIAGPPGRADINQMWVQPFVNWNFRDGWFLTSSPILTADWNLPLGDNLVVPLGGGGGRVFSFAGQMLNASLSAYVHVLRTVQSPDWTLRFTLAWLFPAGAG